MDALSILALGVAQAGGGGGGGTSDYSDLSNKPQINNVTLSGNKSLSDLGIPSYTAGNNITINNNEISVDGLALEKEDRFVHDAVDKVEVSGESINLSQEVNGNYTKGLSLNPSGAINGDDQTASKLFGLSTKKLWFEDYNLDRTVRLAPNDNYNGLTVNGNPIALQSDIPTVNNARLTIRRNGVAVRSFTANDNVDRSADILVPENTSDLTNDSGFITLSDVPKELPTISTGDAGKVLTVNSGETGVEWAAGGGGGGGSYTFTNGLTESSGTVSWDYNDLFKTTMSQINPQGKYISIGKKASGSDAPTQAGTYSVSLGNLSEDSGYAKCSGRGAICAGDGSLNATGNGSIAMGFGQALRSIYSEGIGSIAMGYGNATESLYSSGQGSVAMGFNVKAHSKGQCAIGKNNIADNNDTYALIVGNGTSNSARSNALTVDWSGNLVCNNIPACPSTDGTYNLQVSIVNGVPTYSWVAV